MRDVVVRGDGIELAQWQDGDTEWFKARNDGAYDVDRDERPMPLQVQAYRLVIMAGDEVLGNVSWHAVSYGPNFGSVAWNLGIGLLPAARGRGAGAEAVRLLVRHLFETTEVDRLEASTDVTNVPAQRTLERAGFTREGVLRGAQERAGVRHDLVGYSLLRTDVTDEKLTASQNASAELASGDGRL